MNIFTITIGIWVFSEVALSVLTRSGNKDKKNLDQGTLRLLWLVILVSVAAAVTLSIRTSFPISHKGFIINIGLAIIVLGMLIRFSAIWSLGRLFTVDVTIRENHTLKQDGLYKWVRHPSYSGALISFYGFGIALNNWLSLILVATLVTWVFLKRISQEEQALEGQFGDAYHNYKKNTYRLFPGVY